MMSFYVLHIFEGILKKIVDKTIVCYFLGYQIFLFPQI
jgi:hypothetical protein